MDRKKPSTASAPQKLYRSIREVSELLAVKPHVLRYWETQFPALRPRKNRAGNRIYRPNEIEMLGRIKTLLYEQRFTIEGARRLLEEERKKGGAPVVAETVAEAAPPIVGEAIDAAAAAAVEPVALDDALAAASAEIAGLRAALTESQAALEEARAQLATRAARDLDRLEALAELRREMEGVLLELRAAPDAVLAAEAAAIVSEPELPSTAAPITRTIDAQDEEESEMPGETLLPAPGFA